MPKKKAEADVEEVAVETEAVPETAADAASAPAKTEAKKFELENLRKNALALFGVSSCTFAGATAGLEGKFSIEEMKGIIDKWCRKEAR